MPRPCVCDRPACTRCTLYRTREDYRRHWDGLPRLPKPQARGTGKLNSLPCVHLGPLTGETRDCRTCGGTKQAPLSACKIHGRCSAGRIVDGVTWCQTCADHSLVDRIVSVDPPRPDTQQAFNCSILPLENGGSLLAYRYGWAGARIGVCELDANHKPVGVSTILEHPPLPQDLSGREDPRLFRAGDTLFMSYIGVRQVRGKLTTHQCLARLSANGRLMTRAWCPHYTGRAEWEKNWGFFFHEGAIHAVYSISPHRVLRIDGSRAELVSETPGPPAKNDILLRGGAAPVRVGDEYYSWYHGKRENGQNSTYWIGLYTFEAKHPFRVRRHTRAKLLETRRADRPMPTVPHVIFPCGAYLRGGKWVVSYGYYDHWCKIAEFDAVRVETWLEDVPK